MIVLLQHNPGIGVFMTEEVPNISAEDDQLSPDSETRLGRFFNRINQFFKRESTTDLKLMGRIRELHTLADQVLLDLKDFKSQCEKEIEPTMFTLVSNVIDSTLKEITRLQKALHDELNPATQVKIFKRYAECIEKAKIWISLRQKLAKEVIQQTLIAHMIQEFHGCIDRDIQVVQDYLNHAVANLQDTQEFKAALRLELDEMLQEHLLELQQLKEYPLDISLESLSEWRSSADRSREHSFSAALHIIDSFSQKLIPEVLQEKNEEVTDKILQRLEHLEAQMDKLIEEGKETSALDDKLRKTLATMLSRLEEEAHALNGDLRFPQEHTQRMQQVLETLASLHKHFC